MVSVTDFGDILPYLVSLIGGGGLVGAVIAFLKVRPETSQLVIKAAEGAVIVQSSVIDDLREQLEAQGTRIEILEKDKQAALWQAAKLRAENELLVQRVKHLEMEVGQLHSQLVRESRLDLMEERLTTEEARNTDIEEAARRAMLRADEAEKREGH